jgi:geranylgeranyl pyrophosphate synthase/uncharacterized protein with NAD-binding domain and iron-sulfur cluster
VLAGGIAGLSAAHELAERGFEVVIAERTGVPGGKARSSPVRPVGSSPWGAEPRYEPGLVNDPVAWVPGEHGFRFFPGFYRHVVDTMERIPSTEGVTAAGHLVPTARCALSQYDRPTFSVPVRFLRSPGDVGAILGAIVAGFGPVADLTAGDLAHFGARIWQVLTSCQERRLAEYEQIPWWTFIGAASRSVAYQKFLAAGITRSLVAAHAETANTRTIGDIFIQLLLDIVDPSMPTSDRVLDGPTNEVWLYPWLQHLRTLGVTYLPETAVTEIQYSDGRVRGVTVTSSRGTETLVGDYYVCALPAERAAPVFSPALIAAEPSLASVRQLAETCLEWMNGVQFYLRRPVRMARGHTIHIDTEWALTSISQIDVWRPGTMDRYGPQTIRSIVSVDVSDWDAPAPNGRTATEHTREEIGPEVWRQLKRSMNVVGEEEVLRDDDLIGWFLDSDIDRDPSHPGRLTNTEPLLVNIVDSWRLRPDAATAVPNLFLASDYVRTNTDLATMEGANEAARHAVNAILDGDGYAGPRCRIWPLHEPVALAPLREYDAIRFGLGLPWDGGLITVAAAAVEAADPVLGPVAETLAGMTPDTGRLQGALDELDRASPALEAADDLAERIGHRMGVVRDDIEGSVPVLERETRAAQLGRTFAPQTPAETDAGDADGPAGFAERLAWYRAVTLAAMNETIPATEPREHLYSPLRAFLAQPSKGLRPALCLAVCQAHGGRATDAVTSAAGIEMLHNAFLVHDDIEDGSEARRGQPTLHRQLGTPLAVNVGDAMNALSMSLFRKNVERLDPVRALRILDEVDHMLRESLEGQALELGWTKDNRCDLDLDDYLRLVLKKTAWYSFIHPMRIGAIVAGMEDDALERFDAFGFLLGAAFQIQDDLLNLTGDSSLYGKEIGGDLWEGKRTLPLLYAFATAPAAERATLTDFAGRRREHRLPRQVVDIHRILQVSGGFERTRQVAQTLADAAQQRVAAAFADAQEGPDLEFVRSLVTYVVDRKV